MLLHENQCLIRILKFCEKWGEDQSTLTLIFEAAIGATNPNIAPIERKMDTLLLCEIRMFLNVLDYLS